MSKATPLLLAAVALLAGCQSTQTQSGPPLTREEVVTLSRSGSSAETIHHVAVNRGLNFPLSVDNIVWMRSQGVTDPAVDALLQAERQIALDREARRGPPPQVAIGLGFGYHHYRSRHWGHHHW